MRLLDPDEFAAWAAERAIEVQGAARSLQFRSKRRHARFWKMPDQQGGIGYPRFLHLMLDDLNPLAILRRLVPRRALAWRSQRSC